MSLAVKARVASRQSQARAAVTQRETLKVSEDWDAKDVSFQVDSGFSGLEEWKTHEEVNSNLDSTYYYK